MPFINFPNTTYQREPSHHECYNCDAERANERNPDVTQVVLEGVPEADECLGASPLDNEVELFVGVY